MTKLYHFLCNNEEGSELLFGCRGHDEFDDLHNCEYRAVEAWKGIVFREEDVSSSLAAIFAFVVETHFFMCGKYRVTSSLGDDVVGIGGDILEKLVYGGSGGFFDGGLLTSNGVESNKKLVVHCTCIVKEGSNNALNLFDACLIEKWAVFFCAHKLGFGAKMNFLMLVWRELVFGGFGVFIFAKNFADFSVHAEVTLVFGLDIAVSPMQVNASIFVACPIFGDVIMFFENIMEVVSMAISYIFDAEIINDEDK